MKTTLVLATTTTPLANGAFFGFYRFTVGSQPPVDTAKPTAEFDLDAGSYTAACQAYAADGSPLGVAVTLDFAVPADAPAPTPAPAATYEAPAGLTVTFG